MRNEILTAVGLQIAAGKCQSRPRIKADDFCGLITIGGGELYKVKCRWPWNAEMHEVDCEIKNIKGKS